MTSLICATDLLPKSECAIDRAGLLAEELGANLSLLHVVSPNASERALEESLQIAISRMKSRRRPPLWRRGPAPEALVRAGNPARLICDAIEQTRSDLLVVGAHDRRNGIDSFSGTIAEKVLGARMCPLLLVQREAHVPYEKVLLALDLSHEAERAVRAAEALVMKTQVQATVVHVYAPPLRGMVTSPNEMAARVAREHAAAGISELLRRESADFRRYELILEQGHPVPQILRAVEIHRPQLLIMGTRAVSRMRRALLGSVAGQLMKEVVDCDLLIVPRDSLEASRVATPSEQAVSRA